MLPYKLEKALNSENLLYSYKDVVELVAFALIPEKSRKDLTIDSFKAQYPDVFDHKMIDADQLISYS
jgi:hypothetical protein